MKKILTFTFIGLLLLIYAIKVNLKHLNSSASSQNLTSPENLTPYVRAKVSDGVYIWGLFDKDLNVLAETKTMSLHSFSDGYCLSQKDFTTIEVFDNKGNALFSFKNECYGNSFCSESYFATSNGHYYDSKGKCVLENPLYFGPVGNGFVHSESARDVSSRSEDKEYYYNIKTKKYLRDPLHRIFKADSCYSFYNGYAVFGNFKGPLYLGVIDAKAHIILDCKYRYISDASKNGHVIVSETAEDREDKPEFGVINLVTKKYAIKNEYYQIKQSDGDVYAVRYKPLPHKGSSERYGWKLINIATGEVKSLPENYVILGNMTDGQARFNLGEKSDRYGIIDEHANTLLEAENHTYYVYEEPVNGYWPVYDYKKKIYYLYSVKSGLVRPEEYLHKSQAFKTYE